MSPLVIKISKDFATLFTTINPIATLALFAGLTASLTRAERHWTALRACIYATIILLVAMTAGQVILDAVGSPASTNCKSNSLVTFPVLRTATDRLHLRNVPQ